MWEAGLSGEEIAREMSVDPAWFESLVSVLDPEGQEGEERAD